MFAFGMVAFEMVAFEMFACFDVLALLAVYAVFAAQNLLAVPGLPTASAPVSPEIASALLGKGQRTEHGAGRA